MTRKQSRELIARLNRDGERIARHFGLVYRSIEAERANVKRRYGICYDDGTIRIRLRHVVSGKPLKYSSLVNTLCHELAHLKHFDHGPRFQQLYGQILEFARDQGIYAPRAVAARSAPGSAPGAQAPPKTRQGRKPAAAESEHSAQLSLF